MKSPSRGAGLIVFAGSTLFLIAERAVEPATGLDALPCSSFDVLYWWAFFVDNAARKGQVKRERRRKTQKQVGYVKKDRTFLSQQ
jgi:hypothetical protein